MHLSNAIGNRDKVLEIHANAQKPLPFNVHSHFSEAKIAN
jgi:hypothetical protein